MSSKILYEQKVLSVLNMRVLVVVATDIVDGDSIAYFSLKIEC